MSRHCFFGLLGFAFASQLGMVAVGGNFFVWELMLVIGAVFGPVIYFTTSNHKAPRWQPALAYIGFAVYCALTPTAVYCRVAQYMYCYVQCLDTHGGCRGLQCCTANVSMCMSVDSIEIIIAAMS